MLNLTATEIATMPNAEFESLVARSILNSDVVNISHFAGLSTSYDCSDELRARAFSTMVDNIRQSALATA
jgi:hypothetical protein